MNPLAHTGVSRLTVDVHAAAAPGAVLLLETDASIRRVLTRLCREAGLAVRDSDAIGKIERWPVGEIVVTDVAHLTPWWLEVGAAHVVVIAETTTDAHAAMACGATTWILRRDCDSLGALLTLLSLGASAGTKFHA